MRQPDWTSRDGSAAIFTGDCLDSLRQMDSGSIQCCVTSPPYWGLRDYGHDGQLGLEKTPEEYVAKMVDVFREVRRVLRDDGTLWLNLGDSYASSGAASKFSEQNAACLAYQSNAMRAGGVDGLKPKDLVGIPWRVAFAMQADGWYLRQDIIWHKPNPMPESVTDRCTKAHEYIFLLAKSERYYYDNDSIREPSEGTDPRLKRSPYDVANGAMRNSDMEKFGTTRGKVNQPCCNPLGRNRRSVWTVSTKPYDGAHFATFPPDLIEPCILAGCPEGGVVLDPFNGSGTTGEVCIKHGRRYVGLELNPVYVELARQRIGTAVREHAKPLFDAKPKCITGDLFKDATP